MKLLAQWMGSSSPSFALLVCLTVPGALVDAAQFRQPGFLSPPVGPLEGLPNRSGFAGGNLSLDGCFEVGKSLCIDSPSGGSYIIMPPAALPEMVLWYSFDKSLPVDESGNRLHLLDEHYVLSPVTVGPGVMGKGGSAAFDGRRYNMVIGGIDGPLSPHTFTVCLWLYLLEDSTGTWRTILQKGTGAEDLMPALLLWPDERRLHARVSREGSLTNGALDASGLVPMRRWTHVCMASSGSVLRLYINGLKDGEVIVGDDDGQAAGRPGVGHGGDLHIGSDPWRQGTKSYIDDFRWYNRVLSPAEIRAMTFPGITGINKDNLFLGCASCTFPEAVGFCKGHSHMCSLQELFAGGFHAARAMGWLAGGSTEVWYFNQQGTDLFAGTKKLGLCCRGS